MTYSLFYPKLTNIELVFVQRLPWQWFDREPKFLFIYFYIRVIFSAGWLSQKYDPV